MAYQDLVVYRLSVTLHDLTVIFCDTFLHDLKYKRTVEQMVQAARSGKQNIVEGNITKSFESQLKLTSVARASFGELLEDYQDFLRQRQLAIWNIRDPRVSKIRAFREDTKNLTNLINLNNWTNLDFQSSENFGNLMICLLHKENYLLDQFLRAIEDKFVKTGGFRENLFRKRREYQNKLNKLD